jgi:hypothetical protein
MGSIKTTITTFWATSSHIVAMSTLTLLKSRRIKLLSIAFSDIPHWKRLLKTFVKKNLKAPNLQLNV